MNFTPNYSLNQPTYADNADVIPAISENMLTIDSLIKAVNDGLNLTEADIVSIQGDIVTINSTSLPLKLDKNGATIESYTEKRSLNATATGSLNLDLSVQNTFELVLTGAVILTFTNIPTSGKACGVTLIVKQGATPYAVTYPSGTVWNDGTAPDISTANKTSILTLLTTDGGTTWYGGTMGTKF